MEEIVVIGLSKEMGRLRHKKVISCMDMEDIKDALLQLKDLGHSVAQIRYHIGSPFCILVKSRTEATIIRGNLSGVVSSRRNWAKGELTLVTSPEGTAYLCLGGLVDAKDTLVPRGLCWIDEGNPAMVRIYFWLNNSQKLPLRKKIPGIIQKSEQVACAAIEQVFHPVY